MYAVDISSSQQAMEIDEAFLREVVLQTLSDEQVASATISVALVDNGTIHELNRRHLDHDYETDVLSFLLECDGPEPRQGDSLPRGIGKHIEGEIIISAEMACQRAEEFHWTSRDELVLYLVHGLLHLVGYDDAHDNEKTLMRSRERSILAHWKMVPAVMDGSAPTFPPNQHHGSQSEPGADS